MFHRRFRWARRARADVAESRRLCSAEALERRIILSITAGELDANLGVIATALPAFLNAQQAKLAPILDHPLPVAGRQLDGAIRFFAEASARVSSAFSPAHTTVDQINADI